LFYEADVTVKVVKTPTTILQTRCSLHLLSAKPFIGFLVWIVFTSVNEITSEHLKSISVFRSKPASFTRQRA